MTERLIESAFSGKKYLPVLAGGQHGPRELRSLGRIVDEINAQLPSISIKEITQTYVSWSQKKMIHVLWGLALTFRSLRGR